MSKIAQTLLTGLLASSCCLAQPVANDFLNDQVVQQLNLTVDPADWAKLQANFQDNTYYHATLTWNGMDVTLGIRSHGGGSRSPVKPNLDLNFAHYTKSQTFLGLPFVTVKANNEDASNLHEWIAMKLYRKMGFPAPREAPAQVYINGKLLGFYFIVEHEDESFLQRNFGESTGYLYQWESIGDDYVFQDLGTDPSAYAQYLDLKTDQDDPDLQNFVNFIQSINAPATTDANFINGLSPYLDPASFLTYGATENVLAESDGVIGGLQGLNNFYLYQYDGQTLYQMIPWDQDFSFSDADRDIMDGIQTGPFINVLARRLIAIPDEKQIYLNMLVKAATLLGGSGGWADTEITREAAIIHEAAINDPNKQCTVNGGLVPCGVQELEDATAYMHSFLETRSTFVISAAAGAGYRPIPNAPAITQAQLLAPGAIVTINGTNLGTTSQAGSVPLPRKLGSTIVSVEGVRAPLVAVDSGKVEFQIPWDVTEGDANVVVSVSGISSNTLDVNVGSAAPIVLAIVHANGAVADSQAPANAGEILSAFLTGLGAVNAPPEAGAASPADPTTTLIVPEIDIAGAPAVVMFSGLTPGFVGLYQVNFIVPPSAPAGISIPLKLNADGHATSSALAIR